MLNISEPHLAGYCTKITGDVTSAQKNLKRLLPVFQRPVCVCSLVPWLQLVSKADQLANMYAERLIAWIAICHRPNPFSIFLCHHAASIGRLLTHPRKSVSLQLRGIHKAANTAFNNRGRENGPGVLGNKRRVTPEIIENAATLYHMLYASCSNPNKGVLNGWEMMTMSLTNKITSLCKDVFLRLVWQQESKVSSFLQHREPVGSISCKLLGSGHAKLMSSPMELGGFWFQ